MKFVYITLAALCLLIATLTAVLMASATLPLPASFAALAGSLLAGYWAAGKFDSLN